MTRPRLGCVGPEKQQELISTAALLAGGCKNGEERTPAFLLAMLPKETFVIAAGKSKRSKRSQAVGAHAANLDSESVDGKKEKSDVALRKP